MQAVRSSPVGIGIEQAQCQATVFWTDAETELQCRARPDALAAAQLSPSRRIYDLKVTPHVTPNAFRRQLSTMRYWLQDAHYSAGMEALHAESFDFYFVTVNRDRPHQVSVHMLDEASRREAREKRRAILRHVREAMDSGEWRDGWQDTVNVHELRDWQFA